MNQGYLQEELEAIQALSIFKPTIKLSEMVKNQPEKIVSAKRVKTKYGDRIVLELTDHQVFLPGAFAQISDLAITQLSYSGTYQLRYLGPVGKTSKISIEQIFN